MKIIIRVTHGSQVAQIRSKEKLLNWTSRRFEHENVQARFQQPLAWLAWQRPFDHVLGVLPGTSIQFVAATKGVVKARTEERSLWTEILALILGATPDLRGRRNIFEQGTIGHFLEAIEVRHGAGEFPGDFMTAQTARIFLLVLQKIFDGDAELPQIIQADSYVGVPFRTCE